MVNPDFENNCVTENKPELKQQTLALKYLDLKKLHWHWHKYYALKIS